MVEPAAPADLSPALRDRILRTVERNAEALVAELQAMVRIPSVVGQEGPMQAHMAELFRGLGLAVETFEADLDAVRQHPAYVETPWPPAGRPNVVGTLAAARSSPVRGGSAPPGRSVIINGHVDVVSPEPVDAWTRDPWGADIVGDRLYGRGACDMKAGLAAGVFAVKSLLDAGLRPRGPVQLQAVVEEEAGGGAGTLATLLAGHRADAFLNPEPQSKITVAMAGINYFRVRVVGRTAHAGRAHTGVNAIGKMNRIYDALVALDAERAARNRFPLFEAGSGRSCHLNPGTYRAGDWPSTVAGWAVLECRISHVPGERMADVKAEVEAAVRRAAEADPWLREHPPVVEWFGWQAEPWVQDPEHPLVQLVKANAEAVYGRPVEVVGKAAGLDTRFCQYFGIPALTFGPDGENTHGIDEWVSIPTVINTAKVLALTVAAWCGVDG